MEQLCRGIFPAAVENGSSVSSQQENVNVICLSIRITFTTVTVQQSLEIPRCLCHNRIP
jgi:hypothetical protein